MESFTRLSVNIVVRRKLGKQEDQWEKEQKSMTNPSTKEPKSALNTRRKPGI